MIEHSKPLTAGMPASLVQPSSLHEARPEKPAPRSRSSVQIPIPGQPIRICRGNVVIGKWPLAEVKERMGSLDLLPTDSFYDEDAAEWLSLAQLRLEPAPSQPPKSLRRPCYCGTGLPFHVCCGTRTDY